MLSANANMNASLRVNVLAVQCWNQSISNSLHISAWQAKCTTEKTDATNAVSDSETGIYFLTLHVHFKTTVKHR